nr:trypsin-like peptidase domain-containing protein [Sediminivirga luteola]
MDSTAEPETTQAEQEAPVAVADAPDWSAIAEQASQSVVAIQVGVDGQLQGQGSGFLYDDQGHVVTNSHVVAPADTAGGEVLVAFNDGSTVPAQITGRDPNTDVAVLELSQVPDGFAPLPVGDSSAIRVGDPVMALGNPLGLADTVTTGIVSALNRPVTTQNLGEDPSSDDIATTITNAIQTDAAINPGNSGGPLINSQGEVIGVNSSIANLQQGGPSGGQAGSIGIGFAIPITSAVTIADQLIETGTAEHPALGITLTSSSVESGGITRGSAEVGQVDPGSAAEQGGIQAGDHIIAVDDVQINNAISLQALIRSLRIGQDVTITVVRDGQEQQLSVTLQGS